MFTNKYIHTKIQIHANISQRLETVCVAECMELFSRFPFYLKLVVIQIIEVILLLPSTFITTAFVCLLLFSVFLFVCFIFQGTGASPV